MVRAYRYKKTVDHNRTHAADVLHGVYYLTSQPIPGFEQIPADSSESPLQKTSLGPLPQSYLRHISVCEETYGILGANFPALELLALYTAVSDERTMFLFVQHYSCFYFFLCSFIFFTCTCTSFLSFLSTGSDARLSSPGKNKCFSRFYIFS